MKSRIRLNDRLSGKQKADIREFCSQEMLKQQKDNTRRTLKILCAALHKVYGFGELRCKRVLSEIEQLSIQRDNDEVFWYHTDKLMEQIGLEFAPEDYENMDL